MSALDYMEEKPNILVVDDEVVVCDLIRDVLMEVGYKIEVAFSGEEAIKKIQEDKFPIVISDLKMPGIDGIEVLKRTKAINFDICVVVMTAYPSIESVIEAMREGAYDYIVKPFNIEDIKLIIRRAAERQYLLHEAKQKEFYRELSILDGLTGVYNHRHFHEVLPREIERAKRYQHAICLLMIDFDDFKKYNDTYGHLAGDKLLQSFSEFSVKSIRSADMIFRYGGEEFAVICTEITKQGGIEVAKRLFNHAKQSMPITISIGLSCFPENAQNKEDLIKRSDEALYQAKSLGKDRVCVFGEKDSLSMGTKE